MQWPFPIPSDNDPIDQSIFLAYTRQSLIGWSHALRGHLCLHWGAAMSTFMMYRVPKNNFKPSQWTRTIIRTLQEYTYSQWVAHNNFIHGATHSASQAIHRISFMTQITEAYNNSSSIPIDELSFTFGIPLTLQLEQNTNIMEAWFLQFQACQKCLANILKQERRNQGKITKFFISHT
jgi:hypothetical protein